MLFQLVSNSVLSLRKLVFSLRRILCTLFAFVLSFPCREIIDNTGKENGIDIIMADRIFHLIAESPEDAR